MPRVKEFVVNEQLVFQQTIIPQMNKGPVKVIKGVKIAHSFLQSVRSVPRYRFKLAYVILQIWLSKNFSGPTSKNGDMGRFNL